MRRFLSIMLSAAMVISFYGCGNKESKPIVDEYGGEMGETAVTEYPGAVAVNSGEEKSDMAKRLGVEKLEYTDSFDVSGLPVSIHLDAPLPEVGVLPSYKISDMTEARIDEAKIASKVFEDGWRALTGEELFRIEMSEFSDEQIEDLLAGKVIEQYEGDKLVGTVQLPQDYNPSDSGHMYIGKCGGTDCMLSFSYFDGVCIRLEPVNPGDFIKEGSLNYMNVYDPAYFDIPDGFWTKEGIYVSNYNLNIGFDENGNVLTISSENAMDYDIAHNMSDKPNRCRKSDDELMNEAEHFLDKALGITMPEGTLTFYGNLFAGENIDYEKSGIEKKKYKKELVFTTTDTYPVIDFNTSVRDGYEIAIDNTIAGIEPYLGRPYQYEEVMNTGAIDITEEGVIGFNYNWKYCFEEELSHDSELLKFEKVMECFEEGLKDNVMMSDYVSAKLSFNDIYLTYVVVDGSGEKAYVPAWSFVGYSNGTPKLLVYINALDGSFVSAEKPDVR